MKRAIKIGCTTLMLLSLHILESSSIFAQSKTEIISSSLDELRETKQKEQLYIQTNKDIYSPGETIWFKASQFYSTNLAISTESKALYVTLSDSLGRSVMQEWYPIIHGHVAGNLELDLEIAEGAYKLELFSKGSFYRDSTDILMINKKDKMFSSYKSIKCCAFIRI